MPPLNLPWTVLGRPVKPVALGFVVLMSVVALTNVFAIDVLNRTIWAEIASVTAAVAAFALMGGWWGRSQRMAEVGLLLAGSVYCYRSLAAFLTDPEAVLTFTNGPLVQATFLSAGACIIAAGSFLLERMDSNQRHGKVR